MERKDLLNVFIIRISAQFRWTWTVGCDGFMFDFTWIMWIYVFVTGFQFIFIALVGVLSHFECS